MSSFIGGPCPIETFDQGAIATSRKSRTIGLLGVNYSYLHCFLDFPERRLDLLIVSEKSMSAILRKFPLFHHSTPPKMVGSHVCAYVLPLRPNEC